MNALIHQFASANKQRERVLRVDQLVQQILRPIVQLHRILQALLQLLEVSRASELAAVADQRVDLLDGRDLAILSCFFDLFQIVDVIRNVGLQRAKHLLRAPSGHSSSSSLRLLAAVHLADEIYIRVLQLVQQIVHLLRQLHELVAALRQRVRLLLRVLHS